MVDEELTKVSDPMTSPKALSRHRWESALHAAPQDQKLVLPRFLCDIAMELTSADTPADAVRTLVQQALDRDCRIQVRAHAAHFEAEQSRSAHDWPDKHHT